MELSPTAYVILGMLRHGPRSGYQIKQVVDQSTRFFWAASYGQIYPELRRLAKAGLLEGSPQREGGRRRTVYRLTRAGRQELRRWLAEPPEVFELRDEALLKLFFADAAPAGNAVRTLEAMQRRGEDKVARLREIEPLPAAAADADPYPYLVLRFGIAFNEWITAWCERTRAELEAAEERPGRKSDAG